MQIWPYPPQGTLYAVALLSSVASNLLLVGSVSNIIVAERAAAYGIDIDFVEYAKVGVPVTLASMAIAAGWLAWLGWLPLLPG